MIHCCRKYGFLLALLLATHVCKAQIIARFTLLFPFDKFEIDANNSKVLDSAYASWKINPQKIQLFGHTDAIGNDPYNDALSIKRVAAAKHYFLSKGLALSNIIADSGLGKRRPLNNNAGPRERQLNRRVEVVLLKPEHTLIEKIYDTAIKNGSHI
ncbi:MAG: OmpA family protein, partial [Ferruginibacter sp.]